MVARAALAVVVLLLAGCATSGRQAVGDGAQEPTATGVLAGVVVDEAVRPVANATAVLLSAAPRTQLTAPDGTFRFDGLAAGAYQVEVTKIGFYAASVSAVIEAGILGPPVKVQIASNPVARPYYASLAVDGFIECGSSLINPCGFANQLSGQNLTNDVSQGSLVLSTNASLIQSELVWSSTQAVAPQLGFTMSAFNPACNPDNYWVLNNTQGASPLLLRIDGALAQEQWVGGGCPLDFSVSASGPYCTERTVVPVVNATVSELCPGMTLQQRFTLYLHAFYNYLPPIDWRFTTDGIVPPPPEFRIPA